MGGTRAERARRIAERVEKLIQGFEEYLHVYDRRTPFTKKGQLENHVRAIKLRREPGNAEAAIRSPIFMRNLMDTLKVWGIGARGSRLVDSSRFRSAIEDQLVNIALLDGKAVDDADLDIEAIRQQLWSVITDLEIVENESRLVPTSKTLHHILPELVVPIDRRYTQGFFGFRNPEFQYGQERFCRQAFTAFVKIARSVDPAQYVSKGWRSSRTKVIDNAIVAFCIAEGLPKMG